MRHPPDLFLMKVFVAIFFTLFFLKIFFFSYSRLPSRSIEGSSCNLQNFTYALFCNRVLSATTSLKLPMKKSFIITRQFHEGEYLNWLHKIIFWLSHLFQIRWAFALFYKSIFNTTFSFLFNMTLKTCSSSVSTLNKITIIY